MQFHNPIGSKWSRRSDSHSYGDHGGRTADNRNASYDLSSNRQFRVRGQLRGPGLFGYHQFWSQHHLWEPWLISPVLSGGRDLVELQWEEADREWDRRHGQTGLKHRLYGCGGTIGGAALVTNADIGGLTLYPGLYSEGGNLSISSANLTLDGQGNSNSVFIFQTAGILNVTSGRKVILTNGAAASNVFWQVASYCSLGTTVSFAGTIMAYTSVTLNTGVVLNGRALAENGNVTLLADAITVP